MKKYLSLLLTLVLLLGILGGCNNQQGSSSAQTSEQTSSQVPTDRKVYPKVNTKWMFYSLKESKLKELNTALAECTEFYKSGEEVYNEDFKQSLYAMINIYAEIETQYDIAYIKFNCDFSSERAKKNYENANKIKNEAKNLMFSFLYDYDDSSNPLYPTLLEFRDEQFPIIVTRTNEGKEYAERLDEIQNTFNTIKNSASEEEMFSLYKEFLTAANFVAEGSYYSNYYEYANDTLHIRDFVSDELAEVRKYVKQYLVPLAEEYAKKAKDADAALSDDEFKDSLKYEEYAYNSFSEDYILDYIKSLGVKGEKSMETAFTKNRIITSEKANANKIAFSNIIGDTPICYFHTSDLTLETVTHELGHYYSYGYGKRTCNNDLSEVFSQANTLLFLSYTSNKLNSRSFKAYEINAVYNMLYQAVSSAIHDEFNSIIINEDVENLSVEKIEKILNELMAEYGVLDWSDSFKNQILTYWRRHGMNNFGYHFSYPAAAVVALQIYLESKTNYENAVYLYNSLVQADVHYTAFRGVVEAWGMYSPSDGQAYMKINELSQLEPLENLIPEQQIVGNFV